MPSPLRKWLFVFVATALLLADGARVNAEPQRTTIRPLKQRRGLRLRARARLARMRFRHTRGAGGLRALGKSLTHAKQAVAHSGLGRGATRLGRGAKRVVANVSARLTQGADWVEHRLPHASARTFHKLRALNPLSVSAFVIKRIRRDPVFFATYGMGSMIFSNAILPALMVMGMGPVAATAVRLATGIPIDIFAVALREHSKREDRSQSLRDSMRGLRHEYGDFVRARRTRNRNYQAARERSSSTARPPRPAEGTLQAVAAGL